MSATEGKERPFRVIVVGAGIAGLVLSNSLQRAGIDHVVIEKHRDIVYPSGASIGVWPNGSRLLSQLGVLDSLKNACSEMNVSYNRNPDGKAIIESKLFDEIISRHGYRFLLLERREFISCLYEGLPSKEFVKTGNGVTGITETSDGVRVTLKDGTVEEGDMVVGCDGVNSSVRQLMWDNANASIPNTITSEEKRSLTCGYKCLVGLSPAMPGTASGSMTVVHNNGFSFLVMTQPEKTFFFVFTKLDKTHHWPAFPKYTAEDIDAEAAKSADLPVNDQLLFGELWAKRYRGEMVNLEEGIFKHWHSGRIVLAGDAAHKFTPNIAFGGNSAMESVATLTNMIHEKLMSKPEGLSSHPSCKELTEVFKAYQEERTPRVKQIFDLSGLMTRIQAWQNPALKIVAKYIFPLVSDSQVADLFAGAVKGGVKLDYLPVEESMGTVAWESERDRLAKKAAKKNAREGNRILAAAGSLMVTAAALAVWLRGPTARVV